MILSLFCGATAMAAAQMVVNDSLSVNEIPTVVVTATRTPKLLKDCPVITQLITAADIKRMDATNVQDLLVQMLPGIEFSKAMSGETTLNVQGVGGNKILFLVDGNRIAGETMDNPDYARLSLDNVDHIEVVKGAASSLYGSQAMGAVINIITKQPTKRWEGKVRGLVGAHNEQRYSGVLGYRKKGFSLLTTTQYHRRGAYEFPEPKDVFEDVNDIVRMDASRSWNVNENVRWKVNEKVKLRGALGWFERIRHKENAEDRRYYDVNGNVGATFAFGNNGRLDVGYSYDDYRKATRLGALKEKDYTHNYTNRQHTGRWLYSQPMGDRVHVTLGGDVMNDYLYSYQFEGESHQQYSLDVLGQVDWDVTEQLNVLGALRYDFFSEKSRQEVTPKLSVMYKWGDWRWRGSYAKGFRTPTLKESYMKYEVEEINMDIYGNRNLRPEVSNNFQTSLDFRRSGYNATLVANYNVIKNRISTNEIDSLGRMAQEYVNIDRMRIFSAEMNVSASYVCGWRWSLSYVFTHEFDHSGQDQGVRFAATRPHTAVARVDYAKKWKNYGVSMGLYGRYLSSINLKKYDRNGQAVMETIWTDEGESMKRQKREHYAGYQLWDLRMVHSLKGGLEVTMRVNNVLNYRPKYYKLNSPLTTGTTLMVGLGIDLDKLF